MCLILLATDSHPEYSLIVAANRDEFLDRPTRALNRWPEAPNIIGGKDLAAGGTWLGITDRGQFAAITNFREPKQDGSARSSRGALVAEFLRSSMAPEEYLGRIVGSEFHGFGLLVGTASQLYFVSNRGGPPVLLDTGVHGLSNHLLDTPWPKVVRGKARMTSALSSPNLIAALFSVLNDRTPAQDEALPNTGVGLEKERFLSPAFISVPGYGTRCSNVLLFGRDGSFRIEERTYDGGVDFAAVVIEGEIPKA